jgi:hypothetical protein
MRCLLCFLLLIPTLLLLWLLVGLILLAWFRVRGIIGGDSGSMDRTAMMDRAGTNELKGEAEL